MLINIYIKCFSCKLRPDFSFHPFRFNYKLQKTQNQPRYKNKLLKLYCDTNKQQLTNIQLMRVIMRLNTNYKSGITEVLHT